MPVYGYRCEQCGEEFEITQLITDPQLQTHDACGGKLQRVFFPIGVIFKGSGFHTTDYRRSGSTPGTDKGPTETFSGDTAASGGSGESKSETKAAPKSESSSGDGIKPKKEGGSAAPAKPPSD